MTSPYNNYEEYKAYFNTPSYWRGNTPIHSDNGTTYDRRQDQQQKFNRTSKRQNSHRGRR